jgi:hypothetical protein
LLYWPWLASSLSAVAIVWIYAIISFSYPQHQSTFFFLLAEHPGLTALTELLHCLLQQKKLVGSGKSILWRRNCMIDARSGHRPSGPPTPPLTLLLHVDDDHSLDLRTHLGTATARCLFWATSDNTSKSLLGLCLAY